MIKYLSLIIFFLSVNSVSYAAQVIQNRYNFDSHEEVRQYFFKGERTYASMQSFPNQYKMLNKVIDEVFGHITKVSGNNDLERPIVLIGKNIGDLSINIQGMTSNAIILRLETVDDINPISKIETLTKLTSLEIERISSSLSLSDNIRYLSQEDQADEMAIKVLSQTKYPNALSKYFLSNASDEEVKQCKEIVDIQGNEPSFGRFSDTHHSNCWRYWRSQKVMKHIVK